MNPAGYPCEAVLLQGRSDGFPGQPGGPAVVQYTTLNISSEPPKDHIIWSLYCFVCSNPYCLGLTALIFSIKGRSDGFPGQPGGPAVVQYTTVNISSEPPKDHIIWSLYCFVYSNPFCLGLAALIFSIKARDRKMAGELDGARHYASKARCLNIWATVIGSIVIISSSIYMIIVVHVFIVHNRPH